MRRCWWCRDPIVLWIYYEAYRSRLSFSTTLFFLPTLILGGITTDAVARWLANSGIRLITIYGIHTDYFLQVPLIFLMPQILNRDDVIMMGRFLLYVSLPMAALAVFQFHSSPDSLINKGAFQTWYHSVRPSGTFSYISGLVSFFALVASFLFYGFLQPRTYRALADHRGDLARRLVTTAMFGEPVLHYLDWHRRGLRGAGRRPAR